MYVIQHSTNRQAGRTRPTVALQLRLKATFDSTLSLIYCDGTNSSRKEAVQYFIRIELAER